MSRPADVPDHCMVAPSIPLFMVLEAGVLFVVVATGSFMDSNESMSVGLFLVGSSAGNLGTTDSSSSTSYLPGRNGCSERGWERHRKEV